MFRTSELHRNDPQRTSNTTDKATSQGHIVRALTIAGSDSGGGAGIQADLKTMHQFGVYGMSAITALTAQNTLGVQGIYEVTPEFVRLQLSSILNDLGTDAVKTGMLANASIIDAVADVCQRGRLSNIVVDPVMVAKGGASLISDEATSTLRARLIPIAEVVTPNIPEASVLCGYKLESWKDYHRAAEDLAATGAATVIIKGGHMPGNMGVPWGRLQAPTHSAAVDIVFRDGCFTYFATPRIPSPKTHGTGCTFSAAMTALLARGVPILDAVAGAKAFIYGAIDNAKDWDVGHGHGPTDHSTNVPEPTVIEAGGTYFFDGTVWTRVN